MNLVCNDLAKQPYHAFLVTLLFMCSLSTRVTAQDISTYVSQLDKGQTEEVRKALPDLIAKYQNNPGVLYLQGRTASDGNEAVKFYHSVVENFPKSEWADDALYRAYQYYYALGLFRTADSKLRQLKHDYPDSPYLAGKGNIKLPEQDEEASTTNETDTVETVTDSTNGTREEKPAATAAQSEPSENYTLQVGAYTTAVNAEKQKSFFEKLGYEVQVTNKVRGGKSFFLVWVGSFKTPDEAMRFGKEVKAKHKIDSIVVEKY